MFPTESERGRTAAAACPYFLAALSSKSRAHTNESFISFFWLHTDCLFLSHHARRPFRRGGPYRPEPEHVRQESTSRDLGNTHCSRLEHVAGASTPEACMAACCNAGDKCETYQWCAAGQPCPSGFDPQPGALARGHDLPTWPRNTTIVEAEAACHADATCVGYTYHSADLNPNSSSIFHIYLKNSTWTAGDASWSRHMKTYAGCYIWRFENHSCARTAAGWSSYGGRRRAPSFRGVVSPTSQTSARVVACTQHHARAGVPRIHRPTVSRDP